MSSFVVLTVYWNQVSLPYYNMNHLCEFTFGYSTTWYEAAAHRKLRQYIGWLRGMWPVQLHRITCSQRSLAWLSALLLKFLIILSLIWCFVSEILWDNETCVSRGDAQAMCQLCLLFYFHVGLNTSLSTRLWWTHHMQAFSKTQSKYTINLNKGVLTAPKSHIFFLNQNLLWAQKERIAF